MQSIPALLVLQDGTFYKGWSFSKSTSTIGEVVFNTGMTGYQEILTDPSYFGQIINFTYPELGNTGFNYEDNESEKPQIRGIILKSFCMHPNNWRTQLSLFDYLNQHNITSIHGLDNRALTKHLRSFGSINGIISTEELNPNCLLQQLKNFPLMLGLDLVKNVTTSHPYMHSKTIDVKWLSNFKNFIVLNLNIVVIDFGTKKNILNYLATFNCNVIVLPPNVNISKILQYKPDGILLSNGPGDPATVYYGIQLVKEIIKKAIPIFGICMGHQILSLALHQKTTKLSFGHRGLNHPTGTIKKVEITSQNHGFVVNNNSFTKQFLRVTHLNLNDNTLAGCSHKFLPFFSVQYHPEASPGPHDSNYLFTHFLLLVQNLRFNKLKLKS